MKHFVGLFILLLSLLSTSSLYASTVVRSGDTVSVDTDQRVDGNFYILAGSALLSGISKGDVTAVTGKFNLNGSAEQDVLALALTVNINAPVTEDLRLIAGDVVLSDKVGGSVVIVGGDVKILSDAEISGDILFIGGRITIEGKVNGQLLGRFEEARIDGEVMGGVDVAATKLVLGDRANIGKDLKYQSNNEIIRGQGAVVNGTVTRSDLLIEDTEENKSFRTWAISFLILLFSLVVLYTIAFKPLVSFMNQVAINPVQYFLLGLLTTFVVPVFAVTLMVTILGIYTGLLLLLLLVLTSGIALLLLPIVFYVILSHLLKFPLQLNLLAITIGTLLMFALMLVPLAGMVVIMVVYFVCLGLLVRNLYQLLRR